MKDQQGLQFDLKALDVVLDGFARDVRNPESDRLKLYRGIASQIVACTESTAALVIARNEKSQSRVLAKSGFEQITGADQRQLKSVVADLLDGESDAGHHSFRQLNMYLARAKPGGRVQIAFVLLRTHHDTALEKQVFRDLVAELANQIESFEVLKSASQTPRSLAQMTQIAQLVKNAGSSASHQELAFAFTNDLARIAGADRVSFVSRSGANLASNGVSTVSRRTPVYRSISQLGKMTLVSGGSIDWFEGEINVDSKRKPRGLRKVIGSLDSNCGMALPVGTDSQTAGALIVEFLANEPPISESEFMAKRELVGESLDFAAPVLARTFSFGSIPGIRLLDWFFNRFLATPLRSLATLAAITAIMVLIAWWLFFWPQPFEISFQGTMQAKERRSVFAPLKGEVDQILVAENGMVAQRQLIMTMQSSDLQQKLVVVEGELAESRQQLRSLNLRDFSDSSGQNALDEALAASEIERIKIAIQTLESKRTWLNDKISELEIFAPIDGLITTPELRQRLLDRPLVPGDLLVSISRVDGPWQLRLMIPDRYLTYLPNQKENSDHLSQQTVSIPVQFYVASEVGEVFAGELFQLDFRVESRDESESGYVVGLASFDKQQLGDTLRLGSRVYCKVHCGDRSNFFLFTYEIRSKLREWFFF